MKTPYLVGFFLGLIALGVFFVLKFGIREHTIPKITISVFESSEIVSKSLVQAVSGDIQKAQILFFGIDPQEPNHRDILRSFFQMNQSSELKYEAVVMDQIFSGFVPELPAEVFNLRTENLRFMNGLRTAIERKVRLLVVVPPTEASQRLKGSLINVAKAELKFSFSGVAFSSFPRTRDQEANLRISCNTGEEDTAGTASLGCLILQKARGLYRKRFTTGKTVGLLDQVGATDFLFLLAREP